jgi:hypothetical protein
MSLTHAPSCHTQKTTRGRAVFLTAVELLYSRSLNTLADLFKSPQELTPLFEQGAAKLRALFPLAVQAFPDLYSVRS